MLERQNSVVLNLENALIAIDYHSSVSRMNHNVTATGLALILLEGAEVPDTIVLSLGAQARVCAVVHRSDEEIEASFANVTADGRSVKTPITTQRSACGQRYSGWDQPLHRAA